MSLWLRELEWYLRLSLKRSIQQHLWLRSLPRLTLDLQAFRFMLKVQFLKKAQMVLIYNMKVLRTKKRDSSNGTTTKVWSYHRIMLKIRWFKILEYWDSLIFSKRSIKLLWSGVQMSVISLDCILKRTYRNSTKQKQLLGSKINKTIFWKK